MSPLTRAELETCDPDVRSYERVAATIDALDDLVTFSGQQAAQLVALTAERDEARAEADDFRRAWAILDEPGENIRGTRTAAEVAQALRDRLESVRAQLAAVTAQERRLFTCNDCAFSFDACHTNADGSLTCPVCELAESQAAAERAAGEVAALRGALSIAHNEALDLGRAEYDNCDAVSAALESSATLAAEHDERVRAKALEEALRAVNERGPYTPGEVYAEIRNVLEALATPEPKPEGR